MKRGYESLPFLAMGLFALALSASGARAQSGAINLAWNDCGVFGLANRTFACDTNAGTSTLIGSFIPMVDIPQFNGANGVVDVICSESASLPSWWMLQPGGCRAGALTAGFDFSGLSSCLDPWAGTAIGGVNFTPGEPVPNRGRIRTSAAMPGSTPLIANEEYYFVALSISRDHSTGTGACDGCTTRACFLFQLMQPTVVGGDPQPVWMAPAVSNITYWQGTSGSCPGYNEPPVPVRAKTWGSVKSMYR